MEEQNPPERLVKYYKCDKFSCDALLKRYLWASYPFQFNDPFDCSEKFWDLNSFSDESITNHVNPISQELFLSNTNLEDRRGIFVELFAPGIICLNKPNLENEDILWGYYTNQEGIQVEFETSKLKKKWDYVSFKKVEYVRDFKMIKKGELVQLNSDFEIWTKYKKRIWENEEEWRFIFSPEYCRKYHPIFKVGNKKYRQKHYSIRAIKSVALGYKFFSEQVHNDRVKPMSNTEIEFTFEKKDNSYKLKILKYLFKKRIELYQVELSEEFELRKRKIEILEITNLKVVIHYTDIFK